MAVTRKTDLAGYRGQVSVGGYAARPCLIPRSNRVSDLNCPQRGRSSLNVVLSRKGATIH